MAPTLLLLPPNPPVVSFRTRRQGNILKKSDTTQRKCDKDRASCGLTEEKKCSYCEADASDHPTDKFSSLEQTLLKVQQVKHKTSMKQRTKPGSND